MSWTDTEYESWLLVHQDEATLEVGDVHGTRSRPRDGCCFVAHDSAVWSVGDSKNANHGTFDKSLTWSYWELDVCKPQ